MKISFLGHAGFLVETKSEFLIIDPWLTAAGAFLGGWHQYPCNHFILAELIERFKKSSKQITLYVTHDHKDHYDEHTLLKLADYIDFVAIPEYQSQDLSRSIQEIFGKNVYKIKENKKQRFGKEISFEIFIEESQESDSAIIVSDNKDNVFVNLNDCKVQDRTTEIKEKYPRIDVLAQQFSGAVSYPHCYIYDEEKMRLLAGNKRSLKIENTAKIINHLNPKYFVTSAGPPVFLNDEMFNTNFLKESAFPRGCDFIQAAQNLIPSSIELIDLNPGGYINLEEIEIAGRVILKSKDAFRKELTEYKKSVETENYQLIDDIEEKLFSSLFNKLQAFKKFPPINHEHIVYYTNGKNILIRIDLNNQEISKLPFSNNHVFEKKYYLHIFKDELISQVLNENCTWTDYSLSFRYKNLRVPDVYSTNINLFFNANNRSELTRSLLNLDKIIKNEKRMTIEDAETKISYSCKRYCPHAGADLEGSEIKNGELICPRHFHKFDLRNGGKCDRNEDTLDAVPLEN